ncbi:MAG: hypothetical protein WBM23_07920, partial [Desulfomonilia bacterium]
MKRLLLFFIPGGILFCAALIMIGLDALHSLVPPVVRVAQPVILASAVFIGWRFNRSSLVFAVIVLALCDRALLTWVRGFPLPAGLPQIVYHAVTLLLPLNLMMLNLMQERGFLTFRGIARMSFIAIQPLIVLFFARSHPDAFLNRLTYPLLPFSLPEGVPLAQPALLAFGLALAVTAFRFVKHQGAKESGFFWVLITLLTALGAGFGPVERMVFFAAAGLILLVSLIE